MEKTAETAVTTEGRGERRQAEDMPVFRIRSVRCATCIYDPKSPLDLGKLEEECLGEHGMYEAWRQCHEHDVPVCCRGFYDARGRDCLPVRTAEALAHRVAPGGVRFCIPEKSAAARADEEHRRRLRRGNAAEGRGGGTGR